MFVRVVLGEEHVGPIHTGHIPYLIDGLLQPLMWGLSVVAHTVRITEGWW